MIFVNYITSISMDYLDANSLDLTIMVTLLNLSIQCRRLSRLLLWATGFDEQLRHDSN
ncbi:hypothetical protein [Desmonostoc muscorum]|uniref:hypothetical protein n=1 Tax=Desmonostoc muscorum TaxID=1179 RepID=UPI001F157D93|nr:hypothetical protein [Desmonostoc muscorum]